MFARLGMMFEKMPEGAEKFRRVTEIFMMERIADVVDHHSADFPGAARAMQQVAGERRRLDLRQMFMLRYGRNLRRVQTAHTKAILKCDHVRLSRPTSTGYK
ncbi:MAG TPA: hypothetical protein VMJ73_07435 [Rhizomicrobium sp.]|nr:hypothetical protein [Rhizomicrobium sp.]